ARCLVALEAQATSRSYEVIVIDDGSSPPVAIPGALPRVRCVRSQGVGPAAARNTGIHLAAGETVMFTDDDTIPSRHWIEAACQFLETNRDYVGVEGPVLSRPVDLLYEHT